MSGAVGTSRALLPLLLSSDPLLFVVPRERDVEQVTTDLRTLAGEAGLSGDVVPFPAPGPPPFRGLPRHPDAALRRATALLSAGRGRLRAIVASPAGLLRPSLSKGLLETRIVSVRPGDDMTPEILLEALDEGGYRREDPVTGPGQMALRGGIVDLFPPTRRRRCAWSSSATPSRACDDSIPAANAASAPWSSLEILPLSDLFAPRSVVASLRDLLPRRFGDTREARAFLERLDRGLVSDELIELIPIVPDAVVPPWAHLTATVVVLDPEAVLLEAHGIHERAREERERCGDLLAPDAAEALVSVESLETRLGLPPALHLREIDLEGRGIRLATRVVRRYAGDVGALASDLRARPNPTALFLGTGGRAERLRGVLAEDGIATGPGTRIDVRVGSLSSGFEVPDWALTVLADGDIFPEEVHLHPAGAQPGRSELPLGFPRPAGRRSRRAPGPRDRPLRRARDPRGRGDPPRVHGPRLPGGGQAQGPDRRLRPRPEVRERRGRAARHRQARERAAGTRSRSASGRPCATWPRSFFASMPSAAPARVTPSPAESPWQREFEEAFEYEETPDQAVAIDDVAADMASHSPMDRLICGDVGYGKTEVAMRAAMRAALDGKQVAVLTPTTILAFQHWKTFRQALRAIPGEDRDDLPIPQPQGDPGGPGGSRRRARRHPHRDPQAPLQGRGVQGPRPPRDRRGATLRGRRQGEAQASPEDRGLPDPLGDADPQDPPDGARRDSRHVRHRDAPQGSPGHPDLHREVLDRHHRRRRTAGAGAGRTGLLRPQSRGVDLCLGRTWSRGWCRRPVWWWATGRCPRRTSRRRCSRSSRAAPTCSSPQRSSRTASTSLAPTRSS